MLSPQTQFVLHDAAALDAADRMLYANSNAIDPSIFFLVFGCQCTATRFLLWLNDRNVNNIKALKPHILIQCTSSWKLIRFTVSSTFVVTRSFPRFSQTPHANCVINDNDILNRMVSLLSTIVPFLLVWITRSVYWPLCSIMDKKGVEATASSSLTSSGSLAVVR